MKSLSPISRKFKLSFASGLLILLAAIPCGAQQPPMPRVFDTYNLLSDFVFSPDGRLVAATGWDTADVWELASWKRLWSFPANSWQNGVAFSADSRYLATRHRDDIVIWNLATGQLSRRLGAADPGVMAFSPDGRWLGLGRVCPPGCDQIQIWSTSTWQLVRTITQVPGTRAHKVVFSPDGNLVVSAPVPFSLNGDRIKVWDVATGNVVREWKTPGDVQDVSISPDGLYLATGHDKGIVEVRKLATGELLHTLSGHLESIRGLAFTKDGRLAVAAAVSYYHSEVRLWEVAGGRHLLTLDFSVHGGLAISPDDRYLAVGTWRPKGSDARVACLAIWELSSLRANTSTLWSYAPPFSGEGISARDEVLPYEAATAPSAPVVAAVPAEPTKASQAGQVGASNKGLQVEGAPVVQRLDSRPEGAIYLAGPRARWQYLQVSIKVRNASGDSMPIAFPGGTVYLSRGPETYALQDVIWPDKKELAGVIKIVKNGELDLEGPGYKLHVASRDGNEGAVLSLGPGATQELALLFQVPGDAKDEQLKLHVPGGLTVALAGPAGPALIPTSQSSASAATGVSAMFRGNLARTGEGAGKPVERAPRVRWKYKGGEMVASPVIAGDAVYFCTIGLDWKLYALDLATGKVRWSTVVGEVVASPAVAEGRVVVASSQQVLALDQAKGGVLWAKPYPRGTLIWGSPAVRGGLVYVASLTGEVDILDLATGESRGKWTAAGPISSSLAFSENAVFFPTWNKEVTAWGLDSSAQRWNVNLYPNAYQIRSMDSNVVSVGHVGLIPGSAVVGEAAVYAQKMPYEWGHRAGLVALDKETGKTLWEFYPESIWDGKWRSGSGYERLSITTSEGESQWDLMPPGDRVSSAPALAGGTVVFGAIDGKVYAIDAATGKLKWAFVTKDAVYSSPTITGGVVFVGSDDDNLYALDLKTGGELWRFKTKDVVRTTPATADGVVVFASGDGYVYALQE
jgi:outer membrane protein assembly factor BamB